MQKLSFLLLLMGVSLSVWAAPEMSRNGFPEGERLVYTKIVQAFNKDNLRELTRQKKILEKNYPQSMYLDSTYYLIGSLDYHHSRFGDAVSAFDHIVNHFPNSAKRPAAYYGMAMVYKRLHLHKQSEFMLNKVIKEFPGSPASRRAWVELRIAKEGQKG